jgi:SnoaL-like domain
MNIAQDELLAAYFAAWNEPDDGARVELLERAVTDDVEVVPGYAPDAPVCRGRVAFDAHIAGVIASRPSPAIQLNPYGGADGHHGWLRFRWRVLEPGGAVFAPTGFPIEGVDVVRLSADGRANLIVVFLGLS